MITSLLIANRGEIACRIIRTARSMGIRTVAVYSDADAKALHVRQADEAVHIGASPARESYLVGEKIIAAAKATGAEAIHPGYGFLSENAGFAQAVIDAGLVWVGPRPASITAMGLKDAAKALMAGAGVPTTPGYLGEDQSPDRLQAEADAIGYPVLIKAVAGGGGKGMRKVEAAGDFADMLLSCKREAASSFGDDRVLIEKYITRPRHIEVQIFGDTHGNIVHLFERDCSLQRRHQKVIEEAPAPGMDEATREAICAAAVQAGRAVDYVGAGTIEFIADASEGLRPDRIWFMEMNTRLQVEHPVTEEITGVDLVEWQLRVASGEPLPKRQEDLSINGWAIEARLYAENPATGFLPSTGPLSFLKLPHERVRVEAGIAMGDEVTPFYDPMIAKIVVRASDRNAAMAALSSALDGVAVYPVRTNAAFLHRLVNDPRVLAGDLDTGLIAAAGDRLAGPATPSERLLRIAADAFLEGERGASGSAKSFPERRAAESLWNSGFRLNGQPTSVFRLSVEGTDHEIDLLSRPNGPEHAVPLEDFVLVWEAGASFAIRPHRAGGVAGGVASDGAILSPMPGKVIAVEVAEGQAVAKGQKLLTLEAMKMEHSLTAPFDGVVAELKAVAGGQVSEGMMLAKVERAEG
ncbi:acetyl/propionyl/methylcrotonyl-CoA carboxylase subunit alpha [Sphingomonas sp. 1P06PA]|uniref:ATP-binding protein n=1 Tax=Sphingomonas sp. 1P06PA TaxID=554121 RepID=UPI0039A52E63